MKTIMTAAAAALMAFTACTQEKATRIQTDLANYEIFETKSGKQLYLGLIKHGSVCIDCDSLHIQVDPVTDYGRHVDYSRFPKANLVLITHEHHDHLDTVAINAVSTDNTLCIVGERAYEVLNDESAITLPYDNNMDFARDGKSYLNVKAVAAYNTTEGREQFHPYGAGCGYVVTIDGLKIYIAGDTEDIPEMSELKDIDIALLPVNQPYTMTPEQAVKAALAFKPRILIPYHTGDTDLAPIAEGLKDSGIEVRLRDMQ